MMALSTTVSNRLIVFIGATMSVFHLYVALVGPPQAYVMRGVHLAFALTLAFLLLPGIGKRAARVGILDLILMLLAVAGARYPSVTLEYIVTRLPYVDDPNLYDYLFGGLLVILLLEANRRATRWGLPLIAHPLLVYAFTFCHQSIASPMIPT